ncbi:MAG: hypothetical protein ACRCTY_06125 [Candidatus Adiutrix sp.]
MIFKKTRQRIKKRIEEHKERIWEPANLLANRLKALKSFDKTVEPKSFDELLESWGTTYEELPNVLLSLKKRCGIFLGVVLVIGGLLLVQGFIFSTLLVAIPGLIGVVTTVWRIDLVKNKRFVPFKVWFLTRPNKDTAKKGK